MWGASQIAVNQRKHKPGRLGCIGRRFDWDHCGAVYVHRSIDLMSKGRLCEEHWIFQVYLIYLIQCGHLHAISVLSWHEFVRRDVVFQHQEHQIDTIAHDHFDLVD